ncbi:MAG: hypothetical protein R3B39_02550 [Candidatus Paceibacterota bacterium]
MAEQKRRKRITPGKVNVVKILKQPGNMATQQAQNKFRPNGRYVETRILGPVGHAFITPLV